MAANLSCNNSNKKIAITKLQAHMDIASICW
jgi:hypothetical protein